MDESPCREFTVEMLEDNALEWHFTILGPPDTPYAKGYYHGKILVPADYPFKPPDVVLLTPNGRFELDKRICLSISSYHPENWHPTWGIATVLHALREFMATPGNNAIGAIEYPRAVREDLALKSVGFQCPLCGCHVEAIKEKMDKAPPAAETGKKEVIVATPLAGPASPIMVQDSPLVQEVGTPSEKLPQMRLPAAAGSEIDNAVERPLPVEPQETTEASDSTTSPPNTQHSPTAAVVDDTLAAPAATVLSPPASPAVAPQAAVVPPAPRRGIVEHRNGEVIVNMSIHSIDTGIQVVLVLIAMLLCKKALFDYWHVLAGTVSMWIGTVIQ